MASPVPPVPPALIVAADFIKTGGMDRANYAMADWLLRQQGEVHLVGHSLGAGLQAHANLHWHGVARPLGSDALGWGRLARAGRWHAREVTRRGGAVVVNGGNCAWPGINWVHYVHAAYSAPVAVGAVRRLWHGAKHRRALADEARALRVARQVIANSERTRRDLIERVGVSPERIRVVYYGTDAAHFSPVTPEQRAAARASLGWPADRLTVLFLGALGDRRKGFDTLLAAWRRLCARADWDLDLAVVGRGAEAGAWRDRAADLGARCMFLGFRRDVPEVLAACSLLVSPTRYEAYGLGVHEALAREVPAVVSASAGVAERYPASLASLLLGDPDSAEEIERCLLTWRTERQRLQPEVARLGVQLRAWSWDDMAAEVVRR